MKVWSAKAAPVCMALAVLALALHPAARAGHEPDINPALRRFTGMVTGLGQPGGTGQSGGSLLHSWSCLFI